jgi:hypothetical protein
MDDGRVYRMDRGEADSGHRSRIVSAQARNGHSVVSVFDENPGKILVE